MSLPTPVGLQREVLALPSNGHYVILGTAGSGKTTMAILRASYLSKSCCQSNERVLLVTFNKTLVTYFNSLKEEQLKRVDVRNYHHFARGYLTSMGLLGERDIVPTMSYGRNIKLVIIAKAISDLIENEGENPILFKDPEVFDEEIQWIQGMGIKTLKDYLEIDNENVAKFEEKEVFFRVFEYYLFTRNEFGYKYDWDDIASTVRDTFLTDNTPRLYKHIVIDEGQDFSLPMLQSLVKAIPDNGSLTFFGDVAQQIYGRKISWRQAGINTPKVWYFKQNYRNTKEIARLGLAISRQSIFKEDVDLVEPVAPKASGPLPAIVKFKDSNNEITQIVRSAIDNSKNQTVAILVRDRETVNMISKKIGIDHQILKGDMSSWNLWPGISIGTYHSAKGLEFDMVILPFFNNKRLPDEKRVVSLQSWDEALSEEVKLIYVAVTRAKSRLIITYSGEIAPLLPVEDGLYEVFER